jgi:hypothetical protein
MNEVEIDGTMTAIQLLVLLLLPAGAMAIVAWLLITRQLRAQRQETAVLMLLQTFGAAQATAQHDPKQLLAWQPLAEGARRLFPAAFATLDAALGAGFPFSKELLERAHARVSSEWLAWEKAHDEEYRIKAAAAEQELKSSTGDAAALARARIDRIQHEKIERYQQRYEDYIRTAKALQALLQ